MLFLFYVYRSLIARLRANLVTMLSIVLFVVGSTVGLTVYLNLEGRLVDSTPPENILVLAKGAVSERGSRLDLEAARKVALLDGIKQSARELVATVFVDSTQAGAYNDPVDIRGIDDPSFAVHHAKLLDGALPHPGSLEVMVGHGLARKFPNLAIGSTLYLPGGAAKISGVFGADGGTLEDEVWTPRSALEVHLKMTYSSSTTLVAESPAKVPELVARINGTKEYTAQATSLKAFQETGAGLSTILKTVLVLLILLSVVATAAIATTMNAAVAIRMPELAAMVAIGIRRGVLARMVLWESMLLAAFGALVGIGAAELVRRAIGEVRVGASAIELTAIAIVPAIGLGLGLLVGLIGGLAPSLQVRRLDIIETLR